MKLNEITEYNTDYLSQFKRKEVPGLYNYKHYEGPNGTYVQIRDNAGKEFYGVFSTPDGESEYESFEELRDAIFQYFEGV